MEAWHSRRFLPDFGAEDAPQFVTFRLADSLPREVLRGWNEELRSAPVSEASTMLRRRIEGYLDSCHGEAVLADTRAASIVEEALVAADALTCRLHAWVVMPNHVHVLLTPVEGCVLGGILQAWKGASAHRINRALSRAGPLWQREYYDRFIRNQEHFGRAVEYIHHNPVKAGLCTSADAWPYSSARLL